MITNKIIYNTSQFLRNLGINFHEENNPRIIEMRNKLHDLGGIQFKIEFYPDGGWTAESVNIDGIITGDKDVKEINSLIKDAVFTYFEIPSYLCNDVLLKADNEPVTVLQKVYV